MSLGALAGRTAIVTGSGRGIGAAIARRLDADGARLALVARSADQLADVAATLRTPPVVIVADLGTEDGPQRVADEALGAFAGRVDVLVNNAAVASRKAAPDYTVAEITEMLHINVRGVLLLTAAPSITPPSGAIATPSVTSSPVPRRSRSGASTTSLVLVTPSTSNASATSRCAPTRRPRC